MDSVRAERKEGDGMNCRTCGAKGGCRTGCPAKGKKRASQPPTVPNLPTADLQDPKPGQVPWMPLLCWRCRGRHPGLDGTCGYCLYTLNALASRVNCVPAELVPGIRQVRYVRDQR